MSDSPGHEVEGYVRGAAPEPDFEVKSICQSIGEGYISTEEAKAYVRKAFAQGYLARKAPRQAAADQRALELALEVARQVGGPYWDTHRLNTGLMKFITRLRAELRQPEVK